MTEFKVNEYITLKLEGKETNIYVKGTKFMQCKRLVLNISIKDSGLYDHFDSIDEASEYYDHYLYKHKVQEERDGRLELSSYDGEISYEEEFWGHCSNLQMWYKHEYDTRVLKANLAFPLLKQLTERGDMLAKKVFKEEIAKRIESGYKSVVLYLFNEHYLDYLEDEELKSLFFDPDAKVVKFVFDSLTETDYHSKVSAFTLSRYLSEDLQRKFISIIIEKSDSLKKYFYLFQGKEMIPIYRQLLFELLRSRNFSVIRKDLIFVGLKSYVIDFKMRDVEAKNILKKEIEETFEIGNLEEITQLIKTDLLYILNREELHSMILSPRYDFVKKSIEIIKSGLSNSEKTFLVFNIVKLLMKVRDKNITKIVTEQIRTEVESSSEFNKLELELFEEINLFQTNSQNHYENLLGNAGVELITLLEERIEPRQKELLKVKLELLGQDVIEPIFKLLISDFSDINQEHPISFIFQFSNKNLKKNFYSDVLTKNLEIDPTLLYEGYWKSLARKELSYFEKSFLINDFASRIFKTRKLKNPQV